ARAAGGGAAAAAAPRAPAVVLGAVALRAVLVPVLRGARRGPAGARGGGVGAGPRGACGDGGRRCRAPPPRASRPPHAGASPCLLARASSLPPPTRARLGGRAHPALRRGVLRLGARPPDRRARRSRGRAALRIRARRGSAPRPARRPPARRRARGGGRLQDEL